MKISHFPVSIRSILAVNLVVWMIAAAALTVMLLAGAISAGAVEPLVAPSSDSIEVEVLDTAIVAVPVATVDTQVSSIAIVRAP